jgi:glycosyltransferase involved in cell wall biosynthesis
MKENLSVIIITWNEEKNIRECLESVKWANEIVLVDQLSFDRTLEITREYTDKIYITENKGFCEPDRMFAISKTSFEWVLYLDADERISPQLRDEIISLLSGSAEKSDAYYIHRKTFFLGRWIKECGWDIYLVRLFKKDKVLFTTRIHEGGKPLGSVGYLKGGILHYSYRDLNEYFEKFNRYTTIYAEQEYKKGVRINKSNFMMLLFVKPIILFLYKFFLQNGFKEGRRGFFISFGAALGKFMSYAKLWEKQDAFLTREQKND